MGKSKFKIGDNVKIIKYGHPMWITKGSYEHKLFKDYVILQENEKTIIIDMYPEYIGQTGIVKDTSKSETGRYSYSLNGTSKSAWWNEEQLEIIH